MLSLPRLAALSALTVALAPAASAVLIDDFETGDFELNLRGDTSTAPVSSTSSGAGIVGGDRKTSLRIRQGGGTVSAATFGAALGVGSTPGGVLLLSDSFNGLANLNLDYANLGGIDLTDGGASNAFAIDFRGIQGVSRVFVRVDSGTGSGTLPQLAFAFDSDNAPDSLRDDQALYFAFSAANYANVDFTDVSRIIVGFDNRNTKVVNGFTVGATDLAIDTISTLFIPEPASATLAAAGLALLATRRRRA
ncbi:PEP-CTERM domain protein [Phycisphaera mikurensis]|uniref:PEP-CTERM protein-sorting domain-containing protein n=1 Tax=Phycisphaera mikurensis (strain NBRC 102666 / KCTC 22515 / FYK2301M01) TaxID=1142394 RepID=I0IHP0_PHYMF|nr:PEP-CTERM domain protein [Phycisphaera mikurensis]MBB6441023.1 hypothetical protein [Phycisphaera mikurensis]BAM04778.1 hypothetical protein PSMK_26190 [Phycisphaera mikurensis NBRC 102666]